MREFSTPTILEVPPTGNLTDDAVRHAVERPDAALFARQVDGVWSDVSAARWHAEVCSAAKGLIAAGIKPGDRVALLSKTRYEWTLLDYAIWFAGAVTVPVYETSSADQVHWILSDSGATAVLTETAEHRERIEQIRDRLPELELVWSLHEDALGELDRLGAEVGADELETRRTAAGPSDLATLIYTSGTTGAPKGCRLTHGNFMFELGVATEELHELFDPEDASTLLFLPLAHVFARIIQVGAVKAGRRLGHSSDIKNLVADLGEFQPSFLLAVPRVFEKVFNSASQRAVADGKGRAFNAAAETAIAYSRALEKGRVGPLLRARHRLFDRLVYAKLREALGGRCRYAISGGAPLGERLGHFFRGIGVTVLEGYGLTESTAALTVNLPDAQKVGTVGRPLPGTSVRVADDGELLFSGGQVFDGYWQNPQATAEAKEPNGWLHTGDVGEVDDEGFVRITGRKKEILVTAGGKNVAPAALEDQIRSHYLIGHAMVVGEGAPFIAALVTIDPESFPDWCARQGKTGSVQDLIDDPDLRAEVQGAIDVANQSVSRAESVRKFTILAEDWTEEDGYVTPSLKLRRNVVMKAFRHEVDALYDR